jgi:hypothetical protein
MSSRTILTYMDCIPSQIMMSWGVTTTDILLPSYDNNMSKYTNLYRPRDMEEERSKPKVKNLFSTIHRVAVALAFLV